MAASLWILVILGLVGLYVFLKVNPGFRYGKLWSYFLAFVVLFFVFSIGYILTRPEVDVSTLEGIRGAVGLYFSWLATLLNNFGTLTGNAVNIDWGTNSTG